MAFGFPPPPRVFRQARKEIEAQEAKEVWKSGPKRARKFKVSKFPPPQGTQHKTLENHRLMVKLLMVQKSCTSWKMNFITLFTVGI